MTARPLRVLLLPSLPYGRLAAEDGPRRMVTEELRRDHGITVDCIDPDSGWKNPFGRRHPFFRAMDPMRALRVMVARRDYDLIVSGNDGAAVALLALRRLFRFRTPIVVWDLSPATVWRARRVAQDWIMPRLDGVISVNEIQIPHIAARWGARIPVVFVAHWVDTDFFQPRPEANPDAPILAIGDDMGRDYPTFLRAIRDLPAQVSIRTGLTLDLTDAHANVTLLRDRLSAVQFRDLYARSRFVVVPLHRDTANASGNSVIMEAGAMGKAVIVSDSDGVRGFVRHDETGLVVPANDPRALRAAIDRLIREPETRDRLGRAARDRAERVSSPAAFAARLAAAFRQLARR